MKNHQIKIFEIKKHLTSSLVIFKKYGKSLILFRIFNGQFAKTIYWEGMPMIKGVNMQVVEIKDTGNIYFDRVLLFVNPEFYATDSEKLKKMAWDFTSTIGKPPPSKKKINWKDVIIKTVFAIVSGIAITVAIIKF